MQSETSNFEDVAKYQDDELWTKSWRRSLNSIIRFNKLEYDKIIIISIEEINEQNYINIFEVSIF